MKKEFVVSLPEDEISELQRAWYELQADQSTIAFCMTQQNVDFNAIQDYRDMMVREYAEVEMLKGALSRKYKPEEVDLNKYNFHFDFIDKTLVFEEA